MAETKKPGKVPGANFLLLIIGCLPILCLMQSRWWLSSLLGIRDQANQKYETALAEGWDDIPCLKSQIERTKECIEELQIPTSNDTAELLVSFTTGIKI